MKDFYQIYQGTGKLKNFTVSKILYNLTPFLKLFAIGLLVFSFSEKGATRYLLMTVSASIFILSCILNYIRLKIVYEYRYTFDKINNTFTVEKIYFRLRAKKLVTLFLDESNFEKSSETDAVNPLFFKDNVFDYVLTAKDEKNFFSITADTYMYALLTEE